MYHLMPYLYAIHPSVQPNMQLGIICFKMFVITCLSIALKKKDKPKFQF